MHVHDLPMAQNVYELRSGLLDAALAPESGYGKGLVAEPIWQHRPVAVLPRGHPLAAKDGLDLGDVVDEPLVLYRPDTGLGQQ
ncbi:DNA-binding transcriptional LysR family regulator [Ancylobacter polymorphus]|uniref:DNA-binding transcriptional LysR family regulator n=1 Tax=Ancylobacter polymorphus TaxID=223390 RepID=A0ABU0BGD9_9HYPH|nr:DNA-binding transcriptional LysR family regulator [Ancylobacter polymorphus]